MLKCRRLIKGYSDTHARGLSGTVNPVREPKFAAAVGADVGQSQLNMRGMGGNRTLVLLDGLRVVPSDRRSSVSVDYLPSTLMQRVDVVTGGASAVYGSDAVAGAILGLLTFSKVTNVLLLLPIVLWLAWRRRWTASTAT